MNQGERRRATANTWGLREIVRMSGGIIEGKFIRQGDARSEALWDAPVSLLVSASRTGTKCLHSHPRMRPSVSWPGSFFAAYSAFNNRMSRTLVMPVCPTCTGFADTDLFESAHSVMAAACMSLRQIAAAHAHRKGGRA